MLCFTSTDRAQRWMSLSPKSFLEQFGSLVSSEKHEKKGGKTFERNFKNITQVKNRSLFLSDRG